VGLSVRRLPHSEGSRPASPRCSSCHALKGQTYQSIGADAQCLAKVATGGPQFAGLKPVEEKSCVKIGKSSVKERLSGRVQTESVLENPERIVFESVDSQMILAWMSSV